MSGAGPGATSPDAGERAERLEAIAQRAQVRYRTIGDMVYGVLREAILSAVLHPGEHLRQDEIAEMLDVSRMPVRSALLQLESDGLVDFKAHRGAVVRDLGADEIRQIYEIRERLESLGLQKAMKSMTAERLAELDRLAEQLDHETDGDRFLDLRVRFYAKLYDADRNPILFELIQRLRNDVGRYWLSLRVARRPGHAAGHTRLLEFVRAGDAVGAEQFLSEHLRSVADELCQLVANQGELPVD